MTALLSVSDLHVHLGESHVLQGIDFDVTEGGVTALLGRNGVGKTTTLRALLGLVPSRGAVSLDGVAISHVPTHKIVRRGVGYVPEDRDVFAGLTVEENLRLAERDGDPQYELVYDLFPELKQRGRQAAGTLSGGQQQMVAIARALLNRNRVLLVDEPTKGLAPLLVTEVARVLERVSELTTVLLVEQNLGVVQRLARDAIVLDTGRVVHIGPAQELLADRPMVLIASGLSLIYGLMGVLNFAHGAFLTVGAYGMWFTEDHLSGIAVLPRFLIGALAGLAVGAAFAAVVELVLIRPLYRRHIDQVLVTVGLALSTVALVIAVWGNDARPVAAPGWLGQTTGILGAHIPNDRWIEIATAVAVLLGLNAFLRRTRYGLIIRAGVENRAMVTALGIDVRRAFTLVFAIGGVAAAVAGVLSNVYFGTIDPQRGTSLLIFAFIVVVIGGLGSLRGTAIAAVVVGLVQQYANYYASSGLGDLSVVLLLGLVLLARPRGLSGSFA